MGYTLFGDDTFRCIEITGPLANIKISNLTISNGYDSIGDYGGGSILISNHSKVRLDDTIISHSLAFRGGALSILENSTLFMSNIIMYNNTANQFGGGAMYASNSYVNIYKSLTYNNFAGVHSKMLGGGYIFINSTINMTSCNTKSNNATFHGGGAYIESCIMNIKNSNFSKGSAQDGGGIYIIGYKSRINIIKSFFMNNLATFNYGGGIYCGDGATCNILSSIIRNNEAIYEAGGLFFTDINTQGKMIESKIYDNYAQVNSGGIGVYNYATLNISYSLITNNTCGYEGGGILGRKYPTLYLSDSEVSFNQAESGGGLSLLNGALSYLTSNKITSNMVGESYGGGLFIGVELMRLSSLVEILISFHQTLPLDLLVEAYLY
mmetsp:Transcript_26881/g.34900  ORF Transcript_26881/g.34900 Transcript_26881/m.34900 type:complete len:380 (-) Transcript_26881:689-1828(-)